MRGAPRDAPPGSPEAAAVVFPGQGAQRPGMGRDFAAASPVAGAVFDEASDALGLDLRQLCFGDDRRLALTEFAQPALLTAEIAMLRVLEADHGLRATHFGGHSLGEYAALVAAGVLGVGEAAGLVRERGRMMQSAVPPGVGAMAAVSARAVESADVTPLLVGLDVDLASVNGPGQIVISGRTADVAVACERLRTRPDGGTMRVRELAASAPFHSRLVAPIEPGFRALLAQASATWNADRATEVVSNYTGAFHTGAAGDLVDALTRQISGCVRWSDNMRALLSLRPARIVEVGPTPTLRGFFQLLGARVEAVSTLPDARHRFPRTSVT